MVSQEITGRKDTFLETERFNMSYRSSALQARQAHGHFVCLDKRKSIHKRVAFNYHMLSVH